MTYFTTGEINGVSVLLVEDVDGHLRPATPIEQNLKEELDSLKENAPSQETIEKAFHCCGQQGIEEAQQEVIAYFERMKR